MESLRHVRAAGDRQFRQQDNSVKDETYAR